ERVLDQGDAKPVQQRVARLEARRDRQRTPRDDPAANAAGAVIAQVSLAAAVGMVGLLFRTAGLLTVATAQGAAEWLVLRGRIRDAGRWVPRRWSAACSAGCSRSR